ncbi:MAG: pilus assembly protein N-terminal domain-containing protein [Planctomycetaceae bacterium]|nr:pilus assembly protein N-terminal domain-containing protein [Planctomycetaceae bacterium]
MTASAVAQPAPPAAESEAAAAPSSGEPVIRLTSRSQQVKLIERFTKVVTLPDRIARVDGFDQDVIDVTALDSRSIRVHAKAPGVTTMTLLDENDQTFSIDILVVGDVRHLQELLSRLFPTAAIEVVEVRESVVLRGWVTQPSQITEIVEIAEQFYPRVLNQMQVGCVQQVMMKVKVMEVQRSKLRQMGFNFIFSGNDGFVTSTPGGLVKVDEIAGSSVTLTDGSLSNPTAMFGIFNPSSTFGGFIEALKQENLLKILAEPNLMTMNGRPANLLAGGEFPILVPNGLGTVGIEYKPFGVRLEAVPLVLSNSRVRIELQSEVSDRDLNNSVELQGFRVPALTQRRANTQVELNFGETLVIAGLISQNQTGGTSKVPVLGDIPYVGAAFSRKTFQENETELVIMVTPELVAPMTPDQVPPGGPGLFTDTPTDREFYLYNLLEVPSYGPHCEGECPPPVPTYDPYHPIGEEHIMAPGAYPAGPPLPPSGSYPSASPALVPPTPTMMQPRPIVTPPTSPSAAPAATREPTATAPASVPNFPPPAPGPSTTRSGSMMRPTASTARGGVTPVGYTSPSSRQSSRPGLIEPSRPMAQP